MNSRSRIFIALAAALAVASCSTTSTLRDGEYLLRSNKIRVNDKSYNAGDLSAYLLQKPNSWMLGTSPSLVVYNWGGEGKTGIAGIPCITRARGAGQYAKHIEKKLSICYKREFQHPTKFLHRQPPLSFLLRETTTT